MPAPGRTAGAISEGVSQRALNAVEGAARLAVAVTGRPASDVSELVLF